MNLADNAEVVGELFVGRQCIEISKLGIDVEVQQERHSGIVGSLPDDYSISITLVVLGCGNRCRLALLVLWRGVLSRHSRKRGQRQRQGDRSPDECAW